MQWGAIDWRLKALVPIASMYAGARVGKIYGGTNEIMKELISRTL